MIFRIYFVISAVFFVALTKAQIPAFEAGILEVELRVSQDANEVVAGSPSSPITPFQQIKLKYGVTSFEKCFPEFPKLDRFYTLKFTQVGQTEELINDLRKLNEVLGVQQIPVVTMDIGAIPIDAEGDNMWYLNKINVAGWDHWKDLADNARIVTIAIVDNGVRTTHEDLRDVLYRNTKEIPNDGIDNDNNGYIDDYIGYDVADLDNNPNPPLNRVTPTFFSHGTMVAGLSSASTDNGVGIASFGLNTRIIPIKCVYDTATYDHHLVKAWDGVRYAIAARADIINLSWSQGSITEGQRAVLDEALGRGIIIIASAGNYGNQTEVYPAAHPGVIAVGATNNEDRVWTGSNFGTYIDVMAPGENIYTTNAKADNTYGYASGTSFAAPLVSGFVGLLLSQESNPEKVITILKKGCDEIDIENSDKIGLMGAGRINIDRTLDLLINGDPQSLIDFQTHTTILLYPNPSTGILKVSAETSMEELVVFDLSGKEVARLTVNGNTADLTAFQLEGLHVVQVQNASGVATARVYFH